MNQYLTIKGAKNLHIEYNNLIITAESIEFLQIELPQSLFNKNDTCLSNEKIDDVSEKTYDTNEKTENEESHSRSRSISDSSSRKIVVSKEKQAPERGCGLNIIHILDYERFVKEMDEWWTHEVKRRKEWSTQIPCSLSAFVYWCTQTGLQVRVCSTVFAGHYYNAEEYVLKYMEETRKTGEFRLGYPLVVINKPKIHEVIIFCGSCSQDEDDCLSIVFKYPKEIKGASSEEYINYIKNNIIFKSNDGKIIYSEGGSFFRDVLKREIEQLFLCI